MTAAEFDPIDGGLCAAEFPGDDMHIGQLCEEPAGHTGQCRHDAPLGGTGYVRVLRWWQP